jgi:hypothetical protein
MLANVLIESFVLMDIKLGDQERKPHQYKQLYTGTPGNLKHELLEPPTFGTSSPTFGTSSPTFGTPRGALCVKLNIEPPTSNRAGFKVSWRGVEAP